MNGLTFLLDVDNTLLDNDRVEADLSGELESRFGKAGKERYWDIFRNLQGESGFADYLGALQRFRVTTATEGEGDPRLPRLAAFLANYPFADCLYPGALDVIAHLRNFAPTIIVSDGDIVHQPHKIKQSGLWDAVQGDVLIYIHKEKMLDDLERRYPARRYVMIDDKLRILTAMKRVWGERLITVFPRQGHYALDSENGKVNIKPDLEVQQIGDLLGFDRAAFAMAPIASASTHEAFPSDSSISRSA